MGRVDKLALILWVAVKGEGAGREGIYARLGSSVPIVSFSQSETSVYTVPINYSMRERTQLGKWKTKMGKNIFTR